MSWFKQHIKCGPTPTSIYQNWMYHDLLSTNLPAYYTVEDVIAICSNNVGFSTLHNKLKRDTHHWAYTNPFCYDRCSLSKPRIALCVFLQPFPFVCFSHHAASLRSWFDRSSFGRYNKTTGRSRSFCRVIVEGNPEKRNIFQARRRCLNWGGGMETSVWFTEKQNRTNAKGGILSLI